MQSRAPARSPLCHTEAECNACEWYRIFLFGKRPWNVWRIRLSHRAWATWFLSNYCRQHYYYCFGNLQWSHQNNSREWKDLLWSHVPQGHLQIVEQDYQVSFSPRRSKLVELTRRSPPLPPTSFSSFYHHSTAPEVYMKTWSLPTVNRSPPLRFLLWICVWIQATDISTKQGQVHFYSSLRS